jgi:hypothetical protein
MSLMRTDLMTFNLSGRSHAEVNDHAAEFHPIPRGQAGQGECDADVVNPADLYDGASAAVFENAPEGFPIASIWRARDSVAAYSIALVSFYHSSLSFNGFDAIRRIVAGIIHEWWYVAISLP